jgi:hypothetical protein
MDAFFLAALGVIVVLPVVFLVCAALSYKHGRAGGMVC